jgi:integrase
MQGHIHKRIRRDKNGKERTRWYVVVDLGVDAAGRRRQKWHGGFRTRREAEVTRAKLVDELHSGTYVLPGRTTLSEWAIDSWLPMMATRIKPSTLHSYRRNLEIHVLPLLGGKPLHQITAVMLNTLYADLMAPTSERHPLSAKTVSYIHTIVHKALADAVDADLLQRNPADRAKPPRPNRQVTDGIQSCDPDELSAFLAAVEPERLSAIWRLAAMTGMRRGEILGLRWCDLDLDAGRLSVRHAVVAVGYAVIESTPKSHNARVIDLDVETVSRLLKHRRRQHGEREEWAPTTTTTTYW